MLVYRWKPGDKIKIDGPATIERLDANNVRIDTTPETAITFTKQPADRPHRQATGDENDRQGD